MPAYSPCPACQRHVRRHERACPFCAVALPPSPACAPGVPCQAIPRDAKRATVIALSLSLVASACIDDNDTPIYGAPSLPQAGASGSGGRNSGGTSAGGTNSGGSGVGGTDNGGTSGAGGSGAGGNSGGTSGAGGNASGDGSDAGPDATTDAAADAASDAS
jgi:hypothetical protein